MSNASTESLPRYCVFAGGRLIARGEFGEIVSPLKQHGDTSADIPLIFDDTSGKAVDFDLTGTADEVVARHVAGTRSGPGRPKLGVVGREVSLLPRHWEWLEEQPNGISAAIRRLVDEARKREPGEQRARRMRSALSRIMWALAGDLPNFEEATRALFEPDDARLTELIAAWPADVRQYVRDRASEASDAEDSSRE